MPRRIPLSVYASSIDQVVAELSSRSNVISIYQVGSVKNPGISDVDLWVVFADGAVVESDPRKKLDDDGRYLFNHHIFGICQSHFCESLNFEFFHDFRLLYGKDQNPGRAGNFGQDAAKAEINRQAALEYLVKAYFGFTVESTFRVIKVRNFLLHAKALMLDIGPLELDRFVPELRSVLNQVLELRDRWFSADIETSEVVSRYIGLHQTLRLGLDSYFDEYPFYLPADAEKNIGVNSRIRGASEFSIGVSGFRLPAFIVGGNRRLFNLQRRFMHFEVRLPTSQGPLPRSLIKRFEFIRKTVRYNKEYLPNFVPVPYGLPLFV